MFFKFETGFSTYPLVSFADQLIRKKKTEHAIFIIEVLMDDLCSFFKVQRLPFFQELSLIDWLR